MLFNSVNTDLAAEFQDYILWVEGLCPQYFFSSFRRNAGTL